MRRPGGLLLVVALLLLLDGAGPRLLATLEHRLQGAELRLHALTRAPDPDLVLVQIDERSLEQMAGEFGRFPWPRAVHAQLLEGILRQQPAAVVFDIQFSDPDIDRPDSDAYFVEVASGSERTFFPAVLLEDAPAADGVLLAEHGAGLGFRPTAPADPAARAALILPLQTLAQTGRVGLINFLADEDGVGRRYRIDDEIAGWRLPSLPAKVARQLGYAVPDAPSIILNWRGRPADRPQISYSDLYRDLDRADPQRPPAELRGKVVIIGGNAASLFDLRPTPISAVHPGIDILATAIESLKNRDALRAGPDGLAPILVLSALLAVALLFQAGMPPLRVGLALAGATPLLVVLQYLALGRGWLLPALQPLLAAWIYFFGRALLLYVQERAGRLHAVAVFGRFVDRRVVGDLVKDRGALDQPAQSVEITVLFSDIRGFTTLSEQLPPQQVLALLNRLFTRQVDAIFRHGGTVNKFIGDAVMAFWGAPVPEPEQACKSVLAALEMARVADEFRAELGALGHSFDIGIGIHTGVAVVGFLGSQERLEYTAIGDTVNLASRIEGQTKGVARILVSEDTRRRCGERFAFIDHGSCKVKGRTQEVRLYQPTREMS